MPDLNDLYYECSECSESFEGIKEMANHILETHPEYTEIEAEQAALVWAENALEQIEIEDAWKAEEYRRTGQDPENVDRDPL